MDKPISRLSIIALAVVVIISTLPIIFGSFTATGDMRDISSCGNSRWARSTIRAHDRCSACRQGGRRVAARSVSAIRLRRVSRPRCAPYGGRGGLRRRWSAAHMRALLPECLLSLTSHQSSARTLHARFTSSRRRAMDDEGPAVLSPRAVNCKSLIGPKVRAAPDHSGRQGIGSIV